MRSQSSSSLNVSLKSFHDESEALLYGLIGYHGDTWSKAQVSWDQKQDSKVIKPVIQSFLEIFQGGKFSMGFFWGYQLNEEAFLRHNLTLNNIAIKIATCDPQIIFRGFTNGVDEFAIGIDNVKISTNDCEVYPVFSSPGETTESRVILNFDQLKLAVTQKNDLNKKIILDMDNVPIA